MSLTSLQKIRQWRNSSRPHKRVVLRRHESYHTGMSHGMHVEVMSLTSLLLAQVLRYSSSSSKAHEWVMSHTYKSRHTCMSHVTEKSGVYCRSRSECKVAATRMSHVTQALVMQALVMPHTNESCHACISHVNDKSTAGTGGVKIKEQQPRSTDSPVRYLF